MTSLADRVEAELRRPREPLELRRMVLETGAHIIYAPAWALGRLARVAVAVARFAGGAARLGLVDGYRGGTPE